MKCFACDKRIVNPVLAHTGSLRCESCRDGKRALRDAPVVKRAA